MGSARSKLNIENQAETDRLLSRCLKESAGVEVRRSEAQRTEPGIVLSGISDLGHLKITSSLKSEIEGSAVCRVCPAWGCFALKVTRGDRQIPAA